MSKQILHYLKVKYMMFESKDIYCPLDIYITCTISLLSFSPTINRSTETLRHLKLSYQINFAKIFKKVKSVRKKVGIKNTSITTTIY